MTETTQQPLTTSPVQTLNGVEYMTNGKGDLIPLANIKPIDIERDEFVREISTTWMQHINTLQDFKYKVIGDIMAFVELAAEKYDRKLGGKKGNLSLQTYDGEYSLKISMAEHKDFNEQLEIAKDIIDELVLEWSGDSNTNIVAMVNSAFDIDNNGKVSTGKIFGLMQLQINDPTGKWSQAMELIKESVKIIGSKQYVRLYKRNEQGKYENVPLDIAAL